METQTRVADIGVSGLGVMGRNLARNLAHHGYAVAVHNRSPERTRALMREHGAEGSFVAVEGLDDLVASLRRPRMVITMVPAGAPTDAVIDDLVPLLDPGDIVADGGNAHYDHTRRRQQALAEHGVHLVGMGVSGGEEGALHGPSIMPGCSDKAYAQIGPILERISAHVDGHPCCTYLGPDGAGHFVKMVHNGIEYADMQLIGEAYDVLRHALSADPGEIGRIFADWNSGDLQSFLIEVTAQVLDHVDPQTGRPFVDVVADEAGQKGTGRWTVQNALDLGVPLTTIAAATLARVLSSSRSDRDAARGTLPARAEDWRVEHPDAFVADVRQALYASKMVAYAQGFGHIAAAAREYGWDVDRAAVARIWRGGCIIRAQFLDRVAAAYERDPDLPLLLTDPFFAEQVSRGVPAWRRVVAQAAAAGVPTPAFASALSTYDALRAERLPAALVQAQRDFFGAHTYTRVDRPGSFHTLWSQDRSEVEA